jgi:hypothetical protein
MRQQLMRAGMIGVALAGGFIGASGCDDVSTGHLADPSGAVRIVRVLVQDAPANVVQMKGEGNSTRGAAVDLLDHNAPVSCDDSNPCQVLMAFGGGLGDFTCRKGVCNDPLQAPATGVPLNPDIEAVPAMPPMPPMPQMGCTPATPATPATDATPAVAGVSIRIVVDKLLDPSKITSDGTSLLPGVAEIIDDSTGTSLPLDQLNAIWDPAGSPLFTSDPVLAPFGPAIQLSPLGLAHSSMYTVVIHPGLIQDRDGNPVADQNGNLLAKDLTLTFTTEDVSSNITVGSFKTVSPYQLPGDFTPVNGMLPTIYSTDVLQLAFWSNMDIDSFNFRLTGPDGNLVTTAEKYYESPPDPATNTCPEATSTTMQVDLYNTSGTPGDGKPWPVGTYKLVFAINSTDDNTSTFRSSSWPGAAADGSLTFVVIDPPADNSADTDTALIDNHPLPENCPCL